MLKNCHKSWQKNQKRTVFEKKTKQSLPQDCQCLEFALLFYNSKLQRPIGPKNLPIGGSLSSISTTRWCFIKYSTKLFGSSKPNYATSAPSIANCTNVVNYRFLTTETNFKALYIFRHF